MTLVTRRVYTMDGVHQKNGMCEAHPQGEYLDDTSQRHTTLPRGKINPNCPYLSDQNIINITPPLTLPSSSG
jgi:hypothetical protein